MLNRIHRHFGRVSRRTVIRTLLIASGIASVAACAPGTSQAPPQPPAGATQAPPKSGPGATQAPPKPKTLQTVQVRLDWTPYGLHAPFWAAIDEGYFAENGLDVKLLDGQGSVTSLQLIAAGQKPVGFFDGGAMIPGIEKGMDVRMVACLVQRNTFGIISPADTPITKPEDLKGKKIAEVPGGATAAMLSAFLRRTGIPETAVTVVNSDPATQYKQLMARQVDGSGHQVPTAAITYESQNFSVRRLLYADFGINRLSYGIVLLNKTIKDSPDMVRGLLAAVVKGWQYAVERPAGAIALGKNLMKTNLDDPTMEKQWEAMQPFVRTDRTRDRPLFWMDKQDWEGTLNLLREMGSVSETRPVETYYTNEYLP